MLNKSFCYETHAHLLFTKEDLWSMIVPWAKS